MIIMGHTYAWKFLENCDIDCLDQFTKSMGQALYEVTGNHYTIEEYDARTREILLRWSKGYLHGPGETNLKFPRFRFIYRASDIGGSWAAVVYFPRIPHIRAVYSSRSEKHLLSPSVQQELSKHLVDCKAADVFARNSDHTFRGTTAGLYVLQKIQNLTTLRNFAEDSKYTPQGSDLQALLQNLSVLFSEGQPVSGAIELRTKGKAVRHFLEQCDGRVTGSLGNEKLVCCPVNTFT
jgi:hypothetical protein